MKHFHVHIAVDSLPASIDFYSKLFGSPPTKLQTDYAKWMLDDPRVNFAISARSHQSGVNHFGIQADTPEELAGLKALANTAAAGAVLEQTDTACCYANSDKHWTVDPQGLAWEHFLTMSDALTFGEDVATKNGACCIPVRERPDREASQAACCIPNDTASHNKRCCG